MLMTSKEIRKIFLEFFATKGHAVYPAAPIVVKGDPTLMFTNAGMNQFKDWFLGHEPAKDTRVADSQPCLRVSGKHNDLEDVGRDTYHHTLFEMLGNWSFGDYFKKEAIEWAWELLTKRYGLPEDRLYVTVFAGDQGDGLPFDEEAYQEWKKWISEDRILKAGKKDNFWEMGDTGPCGPCTEIHIDLRSDEDRLKIDGKSLVNDSHPQVIEIWNNVFMQFNRMADRSLQPLPAQHVDTGMGFERLTMALQGKQSNYDTDIFTPIIEEVSKLSGVKYGASEKTDIAIRVISDHIRAITFVIADGQLPSNNKAGYVCRRILRRALRYGYSSLGLQQPFMHQLVDILAWQFETAFPQIPAQKEFIKKIILEEEISFLRTLSNGLKRLDGLVEEALQSTAKTISGTAAFELYDTFGFPLDLTQLVAAESGLLVDEPSFQAEMLAQKSRSREDAVKETSDWVNVSEEDLEIRFIGYDLLELEVEVIKHRTLKVKNKEVYQLVLSPTPFYAESGGQVGDTGTLTMDGEVLKVLDTQKENNLIVHLVDKLPRHKRYFAQVNHHTRQLSMRNHSATHLLHAALRQVLGHHVEQKGSLVTPNLLRFDFAHFGKMTQEELEQVSKIVNEKIKAGIALNEARSIPIEEAKSRGAMALFGEKYGDFVRVITFDPNYSVELCGGTHVKNTSEIQYFHLLSESSISAGVRRIEAITSEGAFEYLKVQAVQLEEIKELLRNPPSTTQAVQKLLDENSQLQKQWQAAEDRWCQMLVEKLKQEVKNHGELNSISAVVEVQQADSLKKIAFDLRKDLDRVVILLGAVIGGKPQLALACSDELAAQINCGQKIREIAKAIQGGGGGQPFFATAGGNNPGGLSLAIESFNPSNF